MVESNLKEIK